MGGTQILQVAEKTSGTAPFRDPMEFIGMRNLLFGSGQLRKESRSEVQATTVFFLSWALSLPDSPPPAAAKRKAGRTLAARPAILSRNKVPHRLLRNGLPSNGPGYEGSGKDVRRLARPGEAFRRTPGNRSRPGLAERLCPAPAALNP